MRTLATLAVAGLLLAQTPGWCADTVKPAGVNPAAPPLSVPNVVVVGVWNFAVPYSFTNVHKDLKSAVIRCDVGIGPPGGVTGPDGATVFGAGYALGSGMVTIKLNGQPASGTALIAVNPKPGAETASLYSYFCRIQVSDGTSTVQPNTSESKPWAKIQAGSQITVSGKTKN